MRPLNSAKEPDELMGDAEIDEFDPKFTEADMRQPGGEVTLEEYLTDACLYEKMEKPMGSSNLNPPPFPSFFFLTRSGKIYD